MDWALGRDRPATAMVLPLLSDGDSRLGPGADGEQGRTESKGSWQLGAGQLNMKKYFSRNSVLPPRILSVLLVFPFLTKEHKYRKQFLTVSAGGSGGGGQGT